MPIHHYVPSLNSKDLLGRWEKAWWVLSLFIMVFLKSPCLFHVEKPRSLLYLFIYY